MVHNSIGIVTALLPHIGYKKCTIAADMALKEKRPVADIVVEMGYLKREEIAKLLRPENMCGPTARMASGRTLLETADMSGMKDHEVERDAPCCLCDKLRNILSGGGRKA